MIVYGQMRTKGSTNMNYIGAFKEVLRKVGKYDWNFCFF